MKHLIVCFSLLLGAICAQAFALRGPLEPWMTTNINYGRHGDIGGPMELGSEYRWNLPVLTYGFDQSFLDFFGERGVQAVEDAVAILNALPPASEMDVDAFPLDTRAINTQAEQMGLYDLKSMVLAILVQQLGLAEPQNYVWTLRDREATPTSTNYTVIQRNYDPATFLPDSHINAVQYGYEIYEFRRATPFAFAAAATHAGGPSGTALAQFGIAGRPLLTSPGDHNGLGLLYQGLTRDDAGGLRYIYHPTNVNVEPLPSGITLVTNTSLSPVNVAPRPGVNKIAFTRMDRDASRLNFLPMTNVFVDSYWTNGMIEKQTLRRVASQPDITFRAAELGLNFWPIPSGDGYAVATPTYRVTGVSSWLNNASLNNSMSGAGPGTFASPRSIDFSTQSGRWLSELHPPPNPYLWIPVDPGIGSFDQTANAPVVYGTNVATSVTVSSCVTNGSFVWIVVGTHQAVYQVDCTTNLVDWTPLSTITNTQGHFSITNSVDGPRKFYRALRASMPIEQ